MSDLKIKGRLLQVNEIVKGTSQAGKEWQKLEFIIETFEQFAKKICFTLFGDKTALINGIKINESITVHFNLESREYNGKYFHNLNAWKIETEQADAPIEQAQVIEDLPPIPDEEEGLPF